MPQPLSILDFDQPGHAVKVALAADRLGYRRLWLGEHHSEGQCANPLLLGSLLAAATHRLRLGSGGVCLNYHSPLRIAEDARLIEYLMPGRFDLGITRGLEFRDSWQYNALLDGRTLPAGEEHAARVREVHALVTRRLPAGHPLAEQPALLGAGPPLWLLGISPASARLAAELGAGFGYSLHHAARRRDGPEVVAAYRDAFRPSPEFPEPAVLVVVSGICAATEKRARLAWDRLRGELLPGQVERLGIEDFVVGAPALWHERLDALALAYGGAEIMVFDLLAGRLKERIAMYTLLAREMELRPRNGDA